MAKKEFKSKVFKSEEEEREYYDNLDFAKELEGREFIKADVSSMKPSTKPITIRLPQSMINELKEEGELTDVPYQSLIKIFIRQGIERFKKELGKTN